MNGSMVRVGADVCVGDWFISLLAHNFISLTIFAAFFALIAGVLLYFIYELRQKAGVLPGEHSFVKSLKPSIAKVIITILLSVVSYFGLLVIGFLGFGPISLLVGVVAETIYLVFNLPEVALGSFGFRFSMFERDTTLWHAAVVVHVIWIYFLVCFVAYLVALKKKAPAPAGVNPANTPL